MYIPYHTQHHHTYIPITPTIITPTYISHIYHHHHTHARIIHTASSSSRIYQSHTSSSHISTYRTHHHHTYVPLYSFMRISTPAYHTSTTHLYHTCTTLPPRCLHLLWFLPISWNTVCHSINTSVLVIERRKDVDELWMMMIQDGTSLVHLMVQQVMVQQLFITLNEIKSIIKSFATRLHL